MTSVRTFIRQQGLAVLALVIALTGGVAYAANTVFSEDIVDGEVKSADIANNSVRSTKIGNDQVTNPDLADGAVRSDEIFDGSVGSADIQPDAVTAGALAEFALISTRNDVADDPVGGPALDRLLLDDGQLQIIGRCSETSTNTVTAKVLYKSISANAKTSSVDSTAPGGVNDLVSVPHGTEVTLVSVGPTTGAHLATGTFAVLRTLTATGGIIRPVFGQITASTTPGGSRDCTFQAAVFD